MHQLINVPRSHTHSCKRLPAMPTTSWWEEGEGGHSEPLFVKVGGGALPISDYLFGLCCSS